MSEHWCAKHKTAFFKKGRMDHYAHPIKDAQGNTIKDAKGKDLWCNEDDLTTDGPEPVSTSQPQVGPQNATQEERTEWAPHPKKQASIEAQNARTNLTSLCVAGKLADNAVLSKAEERLIFLLTATAGFPRGNPTDSIVSSPMVNEAVEQGGVVTKVTSSRFPHQGAFLTECWKTYKLQRPDLEEMLGAPITDETDFDKAWEKVENFK